APARVGRRRRLQRVEGAWMDVARGAPGASRVAVRGRVGRGDRRGGARARTGARDGPAGLRRRGRHDLGRLPLDHHRGRHARRAPGRVSGVELAVYAGGPVLGDVEAGVVGGLAGVPFAIVSGGVACVVSAAVFATRVRSFATYKRPVKE